MYWYALLLNLEVRKEVRTATAMLVRGMWGAQSSKSTWKSTMKSTPAGKVIF
jgi:hypothetical protein